MKKILHLVDDEKPGGVQRLLRYLETSEDLGGLAQHEFELLKRGSWRPPSAHADAVVSHLSICWRNFPLFVALRARYASAPLVHVEHSYSAGFVAHNVRSPRRFQALMTASYSLFDRIVAVSEGQARWLVDGEATPANKVRTIQSCVDLSPFLALPPAKRGSRLRLGAIGRLDRQKGFDTLVKGMMKVNPNLATLSIWGDGPEREQLLKLTDQAPHIEMKGATDDPCDAYAASDAMVVPSRWEPYGLVALEARAAARPILVADIDGLPEQARDGGILAPAIEDPDSWAEAIEDLAKRDLSSMNDLARFSAEQAEADFVSGWRSLLMEISADGFANEQSAA